MRPSDVGLDLQQLAAALDTLLDVRGEIEQWRREREDAVWHQESEEEASNGIRPLHL